MFDIAAVVDMDDVMLALRAKFGKLIGKLSA